MQHEFVYVTVVGRTKYVDSRGNMKTEAGAVHRRIDLPVSKTSLVT